MASGKKRRRFDEAFFAPPPSVRVDHLPPIREQIVTTLAAKVPVLNDEAGLDAAYAAPSGLYLDGAGTLFVAGSRGSLIGKDWRENYVSMGLPLIAQTLGVPMPYSIEENQRYKTVEQFMRDHPGSVKNMVGHSKGSAVIDVWKKNNPEFTGKARIYSTPYADPMGKEAAKDVFNEYRGALDRKREMQTYSTPIDGLLEGGVVSYIEDRMGLSGVTGMKERGEERIANVGDFATLLDGSATRTVHGNPLAYLVNGGPHDYHQGVARFTTGFDEPEEESDRPGGVDPNYRLPPGVREPQTFSVPQAKTPAPDTGPWVTLTE
jgi:hypothetical protein